MCIIYILDDIGNAEQLVARNGTGINSVQDLKGKKVATPFVSTTHYHLLAALEDAGVNPKEVEILNLRPPEIAAAWERGDIDAAFVWNPVLARIKGNGKVIISSGDLAKKGKPTFDAIMVNRAWAEQNKEFVTKFIAAIAKADADYVATRTSGHLTHRWCRRRQRSSAPSLRTCRRRWRITISPPPQNRHRVHGSAAARIASLPRQFWIRRSSSKIRDALRSFRAILRIS